MTDDIDTLNQHIRDGSTEALDLLTALPSPCVMDSEAQSPFNVAIQSSNGPVIEALLAHDDALEFAPAVHPKERASFMRLMFESEAGSDIDQAERRIIEMADGPPYWQRTPLLQACRYQNLDAIGQLIAHGARLNAKDLLGDSPLDLCIKRGGTDLAHHFVDACIAAGQRFPVSEEALWELCRSRELFEQADAYGRPNPKARAFIFNFYCANLEGSRVKKMLSDGFDANRAINAYTNPVKEVLTSSFAWLHRSPGWRELAAGYANAKGHPETLVIEVQNDPGPGDMTYDQVVAHHAELNQSVRRTEANTVFMSADEKRNRLALLDILVQSGLDVAKLEEKLDFPLIQDVISNNEPDFLEALADAGFDLSPPAGGSNVADAIQFGCFDVIPWLEQNGHRLRNMALVPADRMNQYREWKLKQAAALVDATPDVTLRSAGQAPELTWELDGESGLSAEVVPDPPRAGEPCTVRLRHDNVYGSRTELRFELLATPKGATISDDENDWQACKLIRETIVVDDEVVDLTSLDEPPRGETPWEAVFETAVTLPGGRWQMNIRITAPEPGGCGVLSDWFVDVAE